RVLARFTLLDAGGIEEASDAIRRLCALGEPALHLLHVELEARLVVLRHQRIEVAETLDEAAVTRKARVGDDDVIDRTLLGTGTGETNDDGHESSPLRSMYRCEVGWVVIARSQRVRAKRGAMTGSATKQSRVARDALDCFACNDGSEFISFSPEGGRGRAGSACR